MVAALPVGECLERRGVQADSRCCRCGQPETIPHLLLHCSFAQEVWSLAPIQGLETPQNSSLLDFLSSSKNKRNLPPAGLQAGELYPWICWQIWLARNNKIFSENQIPASAADIISKATRGAKEWQEAQLFLKPAPKPSSQVSNPPDFRGFRVLVDAAWNATSKCGGFGWHFSNNTDTIHESFSESKENIRTALAAEAWAILYALKQALSLERKDLQVLSDSLSLIQLLQEEESFHIELYGILQDIRDYRKSFNSISFVYIPRLANYVADVLAKRALASLEHLVLNSS